MKLLLAGKQVFGEYVDGSVNVERRGVLSSHRSVIIVGSGPAGYTAAR
jgi:hypothetical protein